VVLGDETSGGGPPCGPRPGTRPRQPAGTGHWSGTTEIAALSRLKQLAFRRRASAYLPAGDGLLQNLSLREQNIRLPLRFGSDFQPDDIEGRVKRDPRAVGALKAVAHFPAPPPPHRGGAPPRRPRSRAPGVRPPSSWSSTSPFDGLAERGGRRAARGRAPRRRGGRRRPSDRGSSPGQDLPRDAPARAFERLIRLGGRSGGSTDVNLLRSGTSDALIGCLCGGRRAGPGDGESTSPRGGIGGAGRLYNHPRRGEAEGA